MSSSLRYSLMLLATIALAGAKPGADSDELVRQGNAAFDRGEYARAVDLYNEAEERITDPGLVAFNQATALYHLAAAAESLPRRLTLYRDAELHYRRCLSDASGVRRGRGLYNLGVCLLQRSQGEDAELLDQAVACFEECPREPELGEPLLADARHNLELAKLLWVKAKAKPRKTPDSGDRRDDDPQPRDAPGGTQDDSRDPLGRPMRALPVGPGAVQLDNPENAISTDKTRPGPGSLPVPPDVAELVELSPEDTARHLEQAAARIVQERRKRQSEAVSTPAPNVKDW